MDTVKLSPEMPEENKCPQCGTPLASGALAGLCPACLLKQGAADETVTGPNPGFIPPTVAELTPLFPQLEILELIGKGGMGAVYKARQKQLDRIVALKILPPGIGEDAAFAERFTREARALAKLNHPGIVTLYEFGRAELPLGQNPEAAQLHHPGGAIYFFLMEFVDGVTLRQLLNVGRISPHEALAIVPQICDALQFAHDQGIVHRDIKPDNILMDRRGRVKVADFGLAKIVGQASSLPPISTVDEEALPGGISKNTETGRMPVPQESLTDAGKVMGTPQYMSPEQVEHPLEVDHRADIYALGVVFYQMLTGELPGKRLEPPSRKVHIDVRLDEVVLRALEKKPELRFQQASILKTQVETIAGTPAFNQPPADAEAFAKEVLSRGYDLSIRSCFRRGWLLVRKNFWPLVGMTALLIALIGVAGSAFSYHTPNGVKVNTSIIALLLNGPLIAGLNFYFLKRIRGERTSVETAFAGFSRRFLQLFLANFVVSTLVVLGLLCLVLPGIYLFVAWIFTLTLVLDKGLDFWAAMNLSRRAVNKHWFKVFFLLAILALFSLGGLILFCLGIFITMPIAIAAHMYAYEDIFGATTATASPIAASENPIGGAVPPPLQTKPPSVLRKALTVFVVIGLIAVGAFIFAIAFHDHHSARRAQIAAQQAENVMLTGSVIAADTGKPIANVRVARIFIERGSDRPVQAVWTDGEGHFEIKTWDEPQSLNFSAGDFQASEFEFTATNLPSSVESPLHFALIRRAPLIPAETQSSLDPVAALNRLDDMSRLLAALSKNVGRSDDGEKDLLQLFQTGHNFNNAVHDTDLELPFDFFTRIEQAMMTIHQDWGRGIGLVRELSLDNAVGQEIRTRQERLYSIMADRAKKNAGTRIILPSSASLAETNESISNPTFTARYSQGQIQLLGVSRFDGSSSGWWLPDGNLSSRQFDVDWGYARAGDSLVGLVFERSGFPNHSAFSYQIVPNSCSVRGRSVVVRANGKQLGGFEAIFVNVPPTDATNSLTQFTVRIGAASGEGTVISTSGTQGAMTTDTHLPDGSRFMLMIASPIEGKDFISLTCSHRPLAEWAVRVTAMDTDGKIHEANTSSTSGNELAQTEARFDKLDLAAVKEFRFAVNPYQWIEFRSISLLPEQRTPFAIVDLNLK